MTIEVISQGATYEIEAVELPIFITINHNDEGKIFELFVRIDDKEHFEITNLVTRLVSMALRGGTDPLIIAKDLQSVYSMTTQHIIPKTTTLCPSIIARIGLVLEQHIKNMENN